MTVPVACALPRRESPSGRKYQVEGAFNINDPVHETITQEALRAAGVIPAAARYDDPVAWEYVRGVFWNDDPEGQLFDDHPERTDDFSSGIGFLRDFKEAKKQAQGGQWQGPGAPLLARSHFGDLQFLHAMATRDGEAPHDTRGMILRWSEFCWKIATGIYPDDLPATSVDAGAPLPADRTIAQLLGTTRLGDVRCRALGSLLHVVQDSYACGHAERHPTSGAIVEFHSYTNQDERKHDHHDAFGRGDTDRERLAATAGALAAVDACTAVLRLYHAGARWADVEPVLAGKIFALDPAARPATAGAGYGGGRSGQK